MDLIYRLTGALEIWSRSEVTAAAAAAAEAAAAAARPCAWLHQIPASAPHCSRRTESAVQLPVNSKKKNKKEESISSSLEATWRTSVFVLHH